MDFYDNSTPWAWRLDPHSGSSSSLGPSTSASLVSTDPLASLSHPSTGSSADGVFWQDFRPAAKRLSRRERKRARLHRFDSDDEEGDQTVKPGADGVKDDVGSEDEDAAGLGNTSSEGSDSEQDDDQGPASSEILKEDKANDAQTEKGSVPPSEPIASTSARRPKRTHADTSASSTQLIAQAIHKHSARNDDSIASSSSDDLPPPLTYRETARLVRLIAMIFRFPKASRRIVRRRRRHDPIDDDTVTSTTISSAPSTSSPDPSSHTASTGTGAAIELKPKYLPSSTTSTSHKPRILAKVHPDDARSDSAAALKLIALLPAALPARVACADWIVALAVQARRDEHGNILLPNAAYWSSAQTREAREAQERRTVAVKQEDTADVAVESGDLTMKVTRSMRQRLGQDAPSIPLPQFWRRPGMKDDGESGCKVEQEDTGVRDHAETEEEAEVDALIRSSSMPATPTPDRAGTPSTMHDSNDDESGPPQEQTNPPREQHAETAAVRGPRRTLRRANLSKLLAERMREKRQSKALLLRTHQSLRKRKTADSDDDASKADPQGAGGEAIEGEDTEMDAETAANTIANSGSASEIPLDSGSADSGTANDGTSAKQDVAANGDDVRSATQAIKQEQAVEL